MKQELRELERAMCALVEEPLNVRVFFEPEHEVTAKDGTVFTVPDIVRAQVWRYDDLEAPTCAYAGQVDINPQMLEQCSIEDISPVFVEDCKASLAKGFPQMDVEECIKVAETGSDGKPTAAELNRPADHPFQANTNHRYPRACQKCGRVPEVHR